MFKKKKKKSGGQSRTASGDRPIRMDKRLIWQITFNEIAIINRCSLTLWHFAEATWWLAGIWDAAETNRPRSESKWSVRAPVCLCGSAGKSCEANGAAPAGNELWQYLENFNNQLSCVLNNCSNLLLFRLQTLLWLCATRLYSILMQLRLKMSFSNSMESFSDE